MFWCICRREKCEKPRLFYLLCKYNLLIIFIYFLKLKYLHCKYKEKVFKQAVCPQIIMKKETPKGNVLVKKLLAVRPYGTATQAFLVEWEGSDRVPKKITFPDGSERKVGYMRDGIMNFLNSNEFVSYERVLDHPSPTKSIVVYRKINDPTICN